MICPHCSSTIREEDRYLMARAATENVLSGTFIAWFVVGVVALLVFASA